MFAGSILAERARITPDRRALIDAATGQEFTYADLSTRSENCAALWHELGIQKGDRVGILSRNRVEYVDAFFAAGLSGVILVPLNQRLTAAELEYIVNDAGLKALMYEEDFADTVDKLRPLAPTVQHWINVEDIGAPHLPAVGRCGNHEADDIYCLLYTSGTTGKPKGVMIPNRQVIFNAYNTALNWELTSTDIAPIITPMCHAGGLAVFLTPIFAAGGTIVLHRAFDADEVWQSIEKYRCTVMMGVPTIFKVLMEHPHFATCDTSSVRWFISGGAPLPLYIIAEYQRRGIPFRQGYGLTEVGVNCFAMTDTASREKLGSIGTPFLFTEAKLLDSEGREVAVGQIGELCLRGDHVCLGYWNNEAATRATIDAEGWFHTGDQARRDSDGYFYIAGRSKDMFISGGVNVYPAEVESVLLQHSSVQDAAVIGVEHTKWGEVGAAFIVARGAVAAEDLEAFLSERLARYKVPQQFFFVTELPRTAYGKVEKPKLQKMYLEQKTRTTSA